MSEYNLILKIFVIKINDFSKLVNIRVGIYDPVIRHISDNAGTFFEFLRNTAEIQFADLQNLSAINNRILLIKVGNAHIGILKIHCCNFLYLDLVGDHLCLRENDYSKV